MYETMQPWDAWQQPSGPSVLKASPLHGRSDDRHEGPDLRDYPGFRAAVAHIGRGGLRSIVLPNGYPLRSPHDGCNPPDIVSLIRSLLHFLLSY